MQEIPLILGWLPPNPRGQEEHGGGGEGGEVYVLLSRLGTGVQFCDSQVVSVVGPVPRPGQTSCACVP